MGAELMTGEMEALGRLAAVEALVAHPGWALVTACWREAEVAADVALHGERADDVVRMTSAQTTCKVLRMVLSTPETLLAGYRALLKGEDE